MKKSQWMTVVGVVMIMAILATPVFATNPTPGSGTTNISLMNTSTEASTPSADCFNPNGTSAGTYSPPLGSLASVQFDPSQACGQAAAGWQGTMVASSLTDLAAVATTHWQGTQSDGVEADSYEGFSTNQISAGMSIPYVTYQPDRQYTQITVMNAGSVPADLTIKYYTRLGALEFTIPDNGIPANGQRVYDLNTPGATIPDWNQSAFYLNTNPHVWVGSVVIETGNSTQKIAAVAANYYSDATIPFYGVSYDAVAAESGATKVFMPSVERREGSTPTDYNSWLGFSVITVQNLGSAATDVTVKFVNPATQQVVREYGPMNVAAGAAIGCNTRVGGQCGTYAEMAELGPAFSGSAIVESTSQDIAAVSFTIRPRDNEAAATAGASTSNAGMNTYLAEIYSQGADSSSRTLWSLLRLQNVTSSEATVTVKFYDRDGNEIVAARKENVAIGAERSQNYNLKTDEWLASLGTNFSGTAYITSNQPLAVVAENLWGLSEHAAYNGYSK